MAKILDWNEYLDTAAEMVAEGIVMLKNENVSRSPPRTPPRYSAGYSSTTTRAAQARAEW